MDDPMKPIDHAREEVLDELVGVFVDLPDSPARLRIMLRAALMRGAWLGRAYPVSALAELGRSDTEATLASIERRRHERSTGAGRSGTPS